MTPKLKIDGSAFRQNLEDLMRLHQYNAQYMAKVLNTTPATLSRYLNSNRDPELAYVVRVSKFFHVSIEYLLGLDEFSSQEISDLVTCYSAASDDDKKVIQAVLEKYRKNLPKHED